MRYDKQIGSDVRGVITQCVISYQITLICVGGSRRSLSFPKITGAESITFAN
jgi:hypothetical protein